jgi:hypothetical protein
MKRLVQPALAATSLCVLTVAMGVSSTAHAFGDTCKDVKITMSNNTSDEIKLTTLEYHDKDVDKWRTEHPFGVDGFQKLEHDKAMTTTRDLEHVSNDKTKLRVTYKHHMGGTKWGNDITVTTDEFTCKDNSAHTVALSK